MIPRPYKAFHGIAMNSKMKSAGLQTLTPRDVMLSTGWQAFQEIANVGGLDTLLSKSTSAFGEFSCGLFGTHIFRHVRCSNREGCHGSLSHSLSEGIIPSESNDTKGSNPQTGVSYPADRGSDDCNYFGQKSAKSSLNDEVRRDRVNSCDFTEHQRSRSRDVSSAAATEIWMSGYITVLRRCSSVPRCQTVLQ